MLNLVGTLINITTETTVSCIINHFCIFCVAHGMKSQSCQPTHRKNCAAIDLFQVMMLLDTIQQLITSAAQISLNEINRSTSP